MTTFRAVVDRIEGDMLVIELTAGGSQFFVDVPAEALPGVVEGQVLSVQIEWVATQQGNHE